MKGILTAAVAASALAITTTAFAEPKLDTLHEVRIAIVQPSQASNLWKAHVSNGARGKELSKHCDFCRRSSF